MAPNDNASDEQRLDEHGKRLDSHDQRLNIHAERIDKLILALQGDERMGVRGLVQVVGEMNAALKNLSEWRDEMIVYWKVVTTVMRWVVILLALIGAGVWWPWLSPYFQALAKMLGA